MPAGLRGWVAHPVPRSCIAVRMARPRALGWRSGSKEIAGRPPPNFGSRYSCTCWDSEPPERCLREIRNCSRCRWCARRKCRIRRAPPVSIAKYVIRKAHARGWIEKMARHAAWGNAVNAAAHKAVEYISRAREDRTCLAGGRAINIDCGRICCAPGSRLEVTGLIADVVVGAKETEPNTHIQSQPRRSAPVVLEERFDDFNNGYSTWAATTIG